MKIKLILSIAMAAALSACATPKQGPMFDHASTALRAAENAGAVEFAPEYYEQASASFSKAEAALKQRRSERAQKLLELSTAQASLAKAISEAALAEQSLGYARSTRY